MAETLPSVVVKEILSKLLSFAAEEVSLARHFKAEHKRLAKRLELIQALLSDAESKQTTATVRLWLKNLETVAYDADAALDELAYEILKRKVEKGKRNMVRDFFSLSRNPVLFRMKMAHKIKEINDSLDNIYKETDGMGLKAVELINSTVEHNEILASLQNISDEVPILKLIYDNLNPSSLKRCFASCSIFPKDSAIGKENLIQLWMALGLLQPHGGSGSAVEDIGSNYFNTLLLNSLLRDAKQDEYGNITSCKMHDLVHNLASNFFCLTSEAAVNDDSEIVHLSTISASGEVPKILSRKLPRLRTLNLNGGLMGDSLKNFKCIRVLILINKNISELPGSIGTLKHLRYLDISKTEIHTLPDDVTKLYNLQTLWVSYLRELPRKFGNLINLRHVYVEGIRGCQIGWLQSLYQLTGELNIYGLKDGKKEEAEHAKLSNKLQIHALGFYWADRRTYIRNASEEEALNDANVLERLKPHSNLKGLTIQDFMGGSFPPWMMMESQSLLYNLMKIKLINCRRCEEIPALGHLPYLKVVVIEGMDNVKCIGPEFYGKQMAGGGSSGAATSFSALRELTLVSMRKLEEWSEAEHPSLVFPCLEVLKIEECEGLRTIPTHFPSVKRLSITGINSLAPRKMSSKLTSLTSLFLYHVDGSEVQILVEELLGNNRLLRQLIITG